MSDVSTGFSSPGDHTGIRIVVAGDRGTGKSSLIATVATESFPDNVAPVLPITRLPAYFYPDNVPITIVDTSSSLESSSKRNEEFKRADAIILTYACDQSMTLSRLCSYWLPELRQLKVKAPVILVGCKLDLRNVQQPMSMEQIMTPIMQQFREIETCIECSALALLQVPEVFYFAQKAVLHPATPLFDQDSQDLQPRCINALRRIFTLCDHDMDGALSDAELNEFQKKCFGTPLKAEDIEGLKRVVQEKVTDGVNQHGLTLTGFLFLHTIFIDKGNLESTWTVLRKFGYDNDLKLRDDFLPVPSKHAPDQSVELTNEAVEFLRGIFRLLDTDNDGSLRPSELDKLFGTAPESPWNEAPYDTAAERTGLGNLSLNGFLSEWALMTRLDPSRSLANLIYIGYSGDPASALHVTRRRSVDCKKQRTERSVFQCFVFGPKNSGKSALLGSLLGRPFSKSHSTTTTDERFSVNVVNQIGGNKKTLILREIPEDEVKKYLSSKEFLAACDVALFLYDISDEYSWKRSRELLVEVARKGEETGYGVPCLLIAAKEDRDPYPMAVQDSMRVCKELGIEAPFPLSVKLSDLNNVFGRIISVAERPHLSIPETETGRKRKHHQQLINRSLMCVSVGAAAAAVGVAAYRVYAARRNTSS
ncbi:mitochondrial Rho GTPase 2 [Ziziphus jujuba]|uniref:Mitochondrial Rho GTPase n=1 Tax=Ziziphus jujuba TaxID=326968 RepID=A0A6P4ASG3_ZIZJJ|nr:mitochondrial Rho GTPase 2 [Ziziphus jujuba]